uniref:Adenosine deaminase n=1 Tax=Plectus sambesii TaxID=2011161 RepID=A0A914V922_9BILA
MLANMLPLAEMKLRTGGDLTLSDEEFEVEKYMRQQRNYIIFQYNADGPLYKYLDYERINLMRSTKLYELLKEMPKGANLHLHLKLAGDYKPLLEHLWDNYRDRLYVNSTGLQLSFENKASSAPLETFTKDTIGGEYATLIPTARKEKSSLDIQQAMADASMAWNYWKEAQNDSNSNLIRTLGFDLVGQEDVGYSWDYQNTQNYIFGNASKAGQYCPIHAGETNWGTNLNREVDQSHVPKDENAFSPDRNLLTAIQNSDVVPRVGHGLALAQHPMWIEAMRARGQCVVVMMLSNQMLQYVQDLRRHPLSAMINSGLKVALSTDDPAMFQINFNDEFIAAFISADLDLAALKAMIINSYDCSLLSQDEKDKKIKEWTMKWDNFINANVPTARSYDPCVNVSQADCYKGGPKNYHSIITCFKKGSSGLKFQMEMYLVMGCY